MDAPYKIDARPVNSPAGEHLAVGGYDDWQMHETGVEPPPVSTEGKVVIDCEPKQDWNSVARSRYAEAFHHRKWGVKEALEEAILAELCRLNANLERK